MPKQKNHHKKNEEMMEELYNKLSARLGREITDTVFDILVKEYWSRRITIPEMDYLYRRERNRRIRDLVRGGNYEEVGIRFGLSATQVRRIVHGD